MEISHYNSLLIGYGTALIGWLVTWRIFSGLWPKRTVSASSRPWIELVWVAVSLIGVILVGQLYSLKMLLPSGGSFDPLSEAINQILIFSPVLVLIALRYYPLESIWMPTAKLWARIAIGLALALAAILAFTLSRTGSDNWLTVVQRVYQPKNFGVLVQVLLEDISIALLFVKLREVLGLKIVIVLVAVLFAAGHIPAFLANGVTFGELTSLILDAGLGVAILSVVQRSSDIWWFWCVHFAMDMMQFYSMPK